MSNGYQKYFRAYRFIMVLNMTPSYKNISLGLRDGAGVLTPSLSDRASALKSTYYMKFSERGFISTNNIGNPVSSLNVQEYFEAWFAELAEAIHRSYKAKGEVYFHLDGLIDLTALYDKQNKLTLWKSGTMYELRYLIDNNLVDLQNPQTSFVKFYIDGKPLDHVQNAQLITNLSNAIQQHKNNVVQYQLNYGAGNNYGNWQGAFQRTY